MITPTNYNDKALQPNSNSSPDNSRRSPSAEDQMIPVTITRRLRSIMTKSSSRWRLAMLISTMLFVGSSASNGGAFGHQEAISTKAAPANSDIPTTCIEVTGASFANGVYKLMPEDTKHTIWYLKNLDGRHCFQMDRRGELRYAFTFYIYFNNSAKTWDLTYDCKNDGELPYFIYDVKPSLDRMGDKMPPLEGWNKTDDGLRSNWPYDNSDNSGNLSIKLKYDVKGDGHRRLADYGSLPKAVPGTRRRRLQELTGYPTISRILREEERSRRTSNLPPRV